MNNLKYGDGANWMGRDSFRWLIGNGKSVILERLVVGKRAFKGFLHSIQLYERLLHGPGPSRHPWSRPVILLHIIDKFVFVDAANGLDSNQGFLRRRGVKMEIQHCRFPWCGTGVEDSNRLLVRCKFVRCSWSQKSQWWGFFEELMVNTGSRFDVSLWLTRNEKTFNNKTTLLEDLILFSKLREMAWIKACFTGDCGFVKFNVDGAAKSDVAGCLGVMRTKSGHVI
ncbi:hypothetical protein GQ457_02G031990 [Hibiscus cannabinus]